MKYVWNGPAGAETVYPADAKFVDGKTSSPPLFEGWLAPGKTTLDLPEEHPLVAAWIARRWLTPAKEDAPTRKTKGADAPSEGA